MSCNPGSERSGARPQNKDGKTATQQIASAGIEIRAGIKLSISAQNTSITDGGREERVAQIVITGSEGPTSY